MRQLFRKASVVPLAVALALGPVPAKADDSIARVQKVTASSSNPKDAKEVSYPTPLVQLVTAQGKENVKKDMRVLAGQAVLSGSANTHLEMGGGLETVLYSDTYVRFDALNIWLLRHGRAYVVSRRGRLEIVAEALGRILVNSKVHVRMDGTQLLAFVTEGKVVLEANARTLSLGPGQAGRLVSGQGPQAVSLTPAEKAEIERDVATAERVMKHGGNPILVVAALAAIGAGVAIVATGGEADLVLEGGPEGCRRDGQGSAIFTVRNQGKKDAPQSITRFEFGMGALELETPALTAGAAAPLVLGPRQLQNLRPRVTVDAGGAVTESDEDNNTVTVSCPTVIG